MKTYFKEDVEQAVLYLYKLSNKPFKPTDGPPAETAAKAYSICTSLPDGLN